MLSKTISRRKISPASATGHRIMDYNEQVNGEPVPVRKMQMEDIETLINQSNSKLGIVYEN